jgi:CheY-like chemotaxis protein
MNIPQAVGIWILGASSGALLTWLQRVSAESMSRRAVEAHLDQALFGRLRRRRPPEIRQDKTRSRSPRVLIAEDDDAVRRMLRESLERDGFEVVAVATAGEALNRIAAENFDASLSELHMLQAGGVDILTAMRHAHPHAVTLVLSSYTAMHEVSTAVRVQADGFMEKPIQIMSLRETLREKLANLELYRGRAGQRAVSATGTFQHGALESRTGSHSILRRLAE